jgi:hypothetical protein
MIEASLDWLQQSFGLFQVRPNSKTSGWPAPPELLVIEVLLLALSPFLYVDFLELYRTQVHVSVLRFRRSNLSSQNQRVFCSETWLDIAGTIC